MIATSTYLDAALSYAVPIHYRQSMGLHGGFKLGQPSSARTRLTRISAWFILSQAPIPEHVQRGVSLEARIALCIELAIEAPTRSSRLPREWTRKVHAPALPFMRGRKISYKSHAAIA